MTVDPDDVALDSARISSLVWYHTSTYSKWPPLDINPTAGFTARTREMMGGDRRVAAWAARQQTKALHVGTYEAAIHNMLRRIDNQGNRGSQFYLYRLKLKPSVVVRKNWLVDPGNFAGDVNLDDVCSPGINLARYLNLYEDPGGLSVALGRDSIASARQIVVPLTVDESDEWVVQSVGALQGSSPVIPVSKKIGIWAKIEHLRSPGVELGGKLSGELSARLPANLRNRFERVTMFCEDDDPIEWAHRTIGLAHLIDDYKRVLAALDAAEERQIQ